MPPEKLMRTIGRMEILIDGAESLLSEYPDLGKKKGFIGQFGSMFDPESEEKQKAFSRLESIYSESYGLARGAIDCFKEYGRPIHNDGIGDALHNASNHEETVNALRAAIGYLRSQAYSIG